MRVLPAITAAGASRRMGRPKALLALGGRSFLAAMAETIARAGLPPPVVVLGADADQVRPEAERIGAEPIENPDHERGRFTSLRVAARHAGERDLLLWPVDCPGVGARTIESLIATAKEHPGHDVVPTHGGRGGHPVVLRPTTLEWVLASGPDGNLRERLRETRTLCPVADPAVLDNVNTPADYEALKLRHETGRDDA